MPDKPWVSGPKELLSHALEHFAVGKPFDYRVALISVDNAVELALQTYLGLPEPESARPSKKELDEARGKLPVLVRLMREYVPDKMTGIDTRELQYYHRLRNLMYHEGNGIAVEVDRVDAYLQIARSLFLQLFDVELPPAIVPTPSTALGLFLSGWADFERELAALAGESGVLDSIRVAEVLKRAGVPAPWLNDVRALYAFRSRLAHGDVPGEDVVLDQVQVLDHVRRRVLGRTGIDSRSSPRIVRHEIKARNDDDSWSSAHLAMKIANSEGCACRSNSGRHHLLLATLQALIESKPAAWAEILERAQSSANDYNRKHGLPLDARPAATVFTTSAMSMNWMRGYLAEGARYGERYSTSGPNVRTATVATPRGAGLALA